MFSKKNKHICHQVYHIPLQSLLGTIGSLDQWHPCSSWQLRENHLLPAYQHSDWIPIMTPASWLRTSSTRRPYSNMFSEMSGGKCMISMLFMRQVRHCVRNIWIPNGPNDIRHPTWESHGVTCSAVSTTATPKVWAITAPACHGQSKRGPAIYLFFDSPAGILCRYTTDIDSMNIIWWSHTLLNMAIDVKIIYVFKMVIFQLQHHLQLTYYKNPWQSLGNDHHSASC